MAPAGHGIGELLDPPHLVARRCRCATPCARGRAPPRIEARDVARRPRSGRAPGAARSSAIAAAAPRVGRSPRGAARASRRPARRPGPPGRARRAARAASAAPRPVAEAVGDQERQRRPGDAGTPRRRRTPSSPGFGTDRPATRSAERAGAVPARARLQHGERWPCRRPGSSRRRSSDEARRIAPRPVPGAAGRRVAVPQARRRRRRCPGPRSSARISSDGARPAPRRRGTRSSPPPRVLDQVASRPRSTTSATRPASASSKPRRRRRAAVARRRASADGAGIASPRRRTARLTASARSSRACPRRRATRSSNSFDSRRAPPRPEPEAVARRVAVLQRLLDVGDARALVLEDQPQAAARRRPAAPRAGPCRRRRRSRVLRASSLAAVTILVWSTRLKPSSTAQPRTDCRTAHDVLGRAERAASQLAARPASARSRPRERRGAAPCPRSTLSAVRTPGQRQPELDERDRDRRPHADDDRLGVEHARHRRDVAEHAADERVDDLERRDVDQHAARACAATIRSVRSSCSVMREPVVHVDLDGDQQELAHLQDRDAVHGRSRHALPGARPTASPGAAERDRERVGQRRLGGHVAERRRRGGRSSARSAGGCR